MIDLDFIRRVNIELEPQVKEYIELRKKRINKWNSENRKKLKDVQKKYSNTEKGKTANIRRNSTRVRRFRESCECLTKKELEDIKLFYLNRPYGMEVDHIIPLSKGGLHHVSNFQYLTRHENAQKHAKIAEVTNTQQIALDILNENEWVNISYLQRKMKVSYKESKDLCLWLSTCYNVKSNDLKTHVELFQDE